jgi:hypothetical protein
MFPVIVGDPPVLVLVGTLLPTTVLPLTTTVSPEDALLLPVNVAEGAEVIVAVALLPDIAVACATRDEKSEAVRGTCGRPEGHPVWPPIIMFSLTTDPLQLASLTDPAGSPTQQTLPQMLPGQQTGVLLHVHITPLQSWRENRFWVGRVSVSDCFLFYSIYRKRRIAYGRLSRKSTLTSWGTVDAAASVITKESAGVRVLIFVP